MDQKDKKCKCSLSFLSPHRVSKCSLKVKKKASATVAETPDDCSSTAGNNSDAKSVATADETVAQYDQKRAVRVTTSDDDDDLNSMLSTVFNETVTNIGKLIDVPEASTPEQLALIARLGNQKCDCCVASRFPHRKIKCKFEYLAKHTVRDLDAARSTTSDGVAASAQTANSDSSKYCDCIGSRFEPHRREKCFFKQVAKCVSSVETVSITVTTTTSAAPDDNACALALEMPRDLYSIGSGFDQVYESPDTRNFDGEGCDDNDIDDAFSAVSEDEFVEYVTVHNKTYTAAQVRAIFESMQREINRLKMCRNRASTDAPLPDTSKGILDLPINTVCEELPPPPSMVA